MLISKTTINQHVHLTLQEKKQYIFYYLAHLLFVTWFNLDLMNCLHEWVAKM